MGIDPKQTAHTPTPWKVHLAGSEGVYIFPNTGELRQDLKFIAIVNGRSLADDQANTELIVRAVNSHAALVEALEAIRNVNPFEFSSPIRYSEKIGELAEAALKAARGE